MGCLIWLLLISIEKVCTLILLLRLVWHGKRKKKFSCFMLVWNHFVWVFMNMDFHWKLKIIINWDIFYIIKNNICCIWDMYMPKNPQLPSFIRNLKFSKFYLIVMLLYLYCNCSVFFIVYLYLYFKKPTTAQFHKKFEIFKILPYRNVS